MDLNEAFNEAQLPERKTEGKFTPIEDGKYNFVLKNYEVKKWDEGDSSINLHYYIPRLNRTEWDKYSSSRMKYLKITLQKLGALRGNLEDSLKAAVGTEGELEVTTSGKYKNFYITKVTKPGGTEGDDIPF